MTVTIELPPEMETRLQEAAARTGQDPAAFITAAVEDKLRAIGGVAGAQRLSLQELDAALDELAAIGAGVEPIDERITHSREDIYFDHD